MSSASSTGDREPAATSTPPTASQPAPKTMGKYQLRKKIGAGGMGAVYLAVDKQLKRTVALKLLPRDKAGNPTLVKRFKAEAQAVAQLKHDNIVTIYEAGEAEGYLYIALEFVEGTDVFKLVNSRGLLPVKRSTDIIKQVARALEHLHSRSIVHRDIKPSNLLIQRDGTVKLTDMGLARSIDDETETGITRAGMTVGTVDYMAPEQARDSKLADIRSDIYSLGCTWYHMLTGTPPFAAGSLTNKLYNHAAKSRPDPREKNESVTEGIVQVMHRMMARKPKDRYQNPSELLADLENINALHMNSAEQLLAAISDVGEGESNSEVATATAVETSAPTAGRGNVALPDSAGENREWVKYVLGFGALAALGVLVLWISQQFSTVFDGSGGVVVNRIRDRERDESGGGAGGPSANGGPTSNDTARGGTSGRDRPGSPGPESNTTPSGFPVHPTADNRTVVQFVPTTDAGALSKITIGRDGEKAYIPPWVAEFAAPEKIPTTHGDQKLKLVTVGRVGDSVSQAPNINAAIEKLPETGGVVQLFGDGPFDLYPLRIGGGRNVVIAGTSKSSPVVLLQPDTENSSRPVVSVVDGSLTLLNLHLTAVAERFRQDGEATMIDVRAADLAVRQCSFTLLGARSGPSTLFRTSPSNNTDSVWKPARLMLDRTFVRGDKLTVYAASGAPCDVIASNCLFLSGAAPLVRVYGTSPSGSPKSSKKTDSDSGLPARMLRFISCTGVATTTAFELAADSGGIGILPTGLLTLNSLFAAPRNPGELVFASLVDWPRLNSRGAGESSFVNLSWRIRSSLCTGWSLLLRHDGDSTMEVSSIPQWQNEWNQLATGTKFERGVPWPTNSLGAVASVEPNRLDPTTTQFGGVSTTDGGAPGCKVAGFDLPSPDVMRRAVALADRPIPSASIFADRKPFRVVPVDLNAGQDLGRFISSEKWRSGTLFVASGSGARKSSPIHVRGLSLRIEFRQTEGMPLQISPRAVNPKAVEQQGILADSLISVSEGGRVEIANGRFRIPNTASVTVPKWLLAAGKGSFLFDSCVVEGAISGNTRNEGIVRCVEVGDQPATSNAVGRYRHIGEIRNCFFKGSGTFFNINATNRAIIIDNSVLVSSDELFDLNVRGQGPSIHGAVHIKQSTLTAKNTFFTVAVSPRNQSPALPLRLFVEETVFAPSLGATPKSGPTLLKYSEPAVRTEKQVEWWGRANGYTHLLGKHADGPAEKPGSDANFKTSWRDTWLPTALVRPLSGSGTVALSKPLPAMSKLAAGDLALHPSSKAAHWTDDGKSIGARLDTLSKIGPESSVETNTDPKSKKKGPRRPKF